MRAFHCLPLPGLALLAACATLPREPTPEHPRPVVLPASETFVLHPRDGGEPYRIWVGLPLSYSRPPGRRYPVLYLLDGDVGFAVGTGVTRFLALTHEMPEVLVVGVGYGNDMVRWHERRVGDLTPLAVASNPGSGGAKRFLEFLVSEVMPLVERRYRTQTDRTLSGYSLGGLFATYVLFHRPGVFQRYMIGSPTYGYADGTALGWPKTLGAGAQPSGIVFTSFGKAEAPAAIAAWRDFWDAVERRQTPDLQVLRAEIDETHSAGVWVALVRGLKAAFAMSPPAASGAER